VLYSPFKFHNGTVGDVVLHNTVVKNGDGFGCYAGETWSRAFFRNNIFIGGPGGTYGGYGNGSGRVLDLADADATCSFDYDGLGSIGTGKFEGKIGETRFSSVATMQSSTTEVHGIEVDMSIFAGQVAFPSNPFPALPDVDLRLAAAGVAVDKGLAIVGINDGFAGAAPDLGAYEVGVALPVYGPRTGGSGGAPGSGGGPGAGGVPGAGGITGGTGGKGAGGKGQGGGPGAGGAPSVGGATGSTGGKGAGGGNGQGGAQGKGGDSGSVVADASGNETGGTAAGGKGGCSCSLGHRPAASPLYLLAALVLLRRGRQGSSRTTRLSKVKRRVGSF
jgi:hypothetical protein